MQVCTLINKEDSDEIMSSNDENIITNMLINGNVLVYFVWERTSTGFTVQVVYNWSATNVVTIDFRAVKFT